MKIPPFIATLGMMMMAKGLALVISGRSRSFQRYACISPNGNGLVDWRAIPGFEVPNAVFILFGAAIIANLIPDQDRLGALYGGPGQQRGGDAAVRRQRGCLEDRGLCAGRRAQRLGGVLTVCSPELGATGAGRYELDAIAAVVIGGTSLSGGRRHHPGHGDRRLYHQRVDKRPAHPVRAAGVADGGHRRYRDLGRLRRYHPSPQPIAPPRESRKMVIKPSTRSNPGKRFDSEVFGYFRRDAVCVSSDGQRLVPLPGHRASARSRRAERRRVTIGPGVSECRRSAAERRGMLLPSLRSPMELKLAAHPPFSLSSVVFSHGWIRLRCLSRIRRRAGCAMCCLCAVARSIAITEATRRACGDRCR